MKHTLWPELEKLGESKVRELLALDIYRGKTRFYVEEWLRYKEFPLARQALRREAKRAAGSATTGALLAAAIALAAFVAHWTLIE